MIKKLNQYDDDDCIDIDVDERHTRYMKEKGEKGLLIQDDKDDYYCIDSFDDEMKHAIIDDGRLVLVSEKGNVYQYQKNERGMYRPFATNDLKKDIVGLSSWTPVSNVNKPSNNVVKQSLIRKLRTR